MNYTGKEDGIIIATSTTLTAITFMSFLLRNFKYNLNGKLVYISAIALPLSFISSIITSFIIAAKIKTEKNTVKKYARIVGTAIFGFIPIAILIYLIYYYIYKRCINEYKLIN
jgi:hypothetical protein